MSENAVVYARYSSHNQTEQSIEGQLTAARKYAKEHDYNIIHYYCDRAKTGTNDNREQFQKMLADSAKGAFSVVIVWKVDRFGRNREEIAFNKYKLKKNKARVEYVAENVRSGPEGVILESVLEGMAEYYSLQLAQNIRRGKLESAKKHRIVTGTPPLGYEVNAQKELSIQPEEALIVKTIFSMVAAGASLTEVMNELNAKGYRTKRGNSFTKNSLPRILSNELYKGTYTFKDIIRDEDAVPAIVDKDLWYRAQEMCSKRTRKSSDKWKYNTYNLTGKIFCGLCGASMMGISGTSSHKSGKYNYYICSGKHQHKNCKLKNIRQDELENAIIDQISSIVDVNQLIDDIWNYYLATNSERQGDIETERAQVAKIDKQIENLTNAVANGMDYTIVQTKLEDLLEQKTYLMANINACVLQDSLPLDRETVSEFLKSFLNGNIIDLNCRQKMLDSFVNSVKVYPDKIEVALNYTPHSQDNYLGTDVCNRVQNWSSANGLQTTNAGVIVLTFPRYKNPDSSLE